MFASMAARSFLAAPSICLLVILLFFNAGGILKHASGTEPGQEAWCVAKPSASDEELKENINFACDIVNCSIIQEGSCCYYPNNLLNHASVVMNLYYQKEGRNYWNCDFKKSALIVVTDPSYGECKYEFATWQTKP